MKNSYKKANQISNFSLLGFIIVLVSVNLGGCNKERDLDVPPTKSEELPTRTSVDIKVKRLFEKYDIKFEYEWDRSIIPHGTEMLPMTLFNFSVFLDSFEEMYIKSILKVQDENKNFLKYSSPLNIMFTSTGLEYSVQGEENSRKGGLAGFMSSSRLMVGIEENFKSTLNLPNDDYLDIFYDHKSTINGADLNSRFSMSSGGILGLYYHEFVHFIQYRHPTPIEFEKISKKHYTSTPNLIAKYSFTQARDRGFVMNYGMSNPDEDFATYVQVILKESDEEFKKHLLVNDKIKIKYQIVLDYFRHLGLDLLKFRDQMHSKEVKDKLIQIKKKYME